MSRRPLLVAVAVAGMLLAVLAAASEQSGSRAQANGAVQSVLVSGLVTLVGLFALAAVAFVVVSLLRRRAGEVEMEVEEESPLPLWIRLLALALAAGLFFLLFFAITHLGHAHHSERAAPLGALNGRQAAKLKPIPFNPAASSVTAVVGLLALGLVAFRRRLALFFSGGGRGLSELSPVELAGPPAQSEPAETAPDPSQERDPRRRVLLAYERFTYLMSLRGRPRRQAETPFEFVRRLSEAERGDSSATEDLTGLFNVARYSPAPVTRRQSDQAVADLAAIEAGLGASR